MIEISRDDGSGVHRRITFATAIRNNFAVAIRSRNYAVGTAGGCAGGLAGGGVGKIQDGNAEQGGKIRLVISQAIMPWRRAGWVTLI